MDEIIKEVYESKSGTAYETYKDAVKIDSSIGLQDVKDYLNSREPVQTHFKYKKYNSFVSPGKKYEFEIYIMDVLARDNIDGVRYGLCVTDSFTKFAQVIPVENKRPDEVIRGLTLIIEKYKNPSSYIAMRRVLLIQSNALSSLTNKA